MQRIYVRHNAAAGLIIIDDCTVHKTFRDHSIGDKRLDHQFMHPVWDVIHFSFAVQPLLSRPTLLQLGPVRVALPEEVLVAERCPVHGVLTVKSSLCLGNHVVDLLLDGGALLRCEDALLQDAVPHQAGLLLPQIRAVVAVLVIIVVGLSELAFLALSAAVPRAVHVFAFPLISVRSCGFQFLPQVKVSGGCHVSQNLNGATCVVRLYLLPKQLAHVSTAFPQSVLV